MNTPPAIAFSNDGPFFPMVAAFMLATTGLGPLYQPDNPLRLSKRDSVSYQGRIEPQLDVDLEQIREMTSHLTIATAVQQLCGMLVISAHAVATERVNQIPTIAASPEMEFFRHVRNACAHGNQFHFVGAEPRRCAAWRGLTLTRATHQATPCIGHWLNAADLLLLLTDIERILAPTSSIS
jgi:hypothetical protein